MRSSFAKYIILTKTIKTNRRMK